jgi:hypothetical protein
MVGNAIEPRGKRLWRSGLARRNVTNRVDIDVLEDIIGVYNGLQVAGQAESNSRPQMRGVLQQ